MIRNIKGKIVATLCALTLVVGSVGINAYADDTELKITKQPTLDELTVTANKENATYQWYKAEDGQAYAVEETVGMIVDGKFISVCDGNGDMNCEKDGVWTGDCLGVYLSVEEGDIVKVTSMGDYELDPMFPATGQCLADDGTGVYTCEMLSAYTGRLYVDFADDKEVSAKVEIVRDGVTYPVINGFADVFDGKKIGTSQGNTYFDDGYYCSYDGRLLVDVYLENGQTLKVTTSDECTANMECFALMGDASSYVSGVDNVYTCIATDSEIYRISIDNGVDFEAEIEVIDLTRGQAIEGQTTNTLTSLEEGAKYSCLVKSGDEEVWSDYVYIEMYIAKQPTTEKPTLEVNFPSEVKSYQWYVVKSAMKKVVDVDASDLAADECMVEDVWDGLYEDGKWHSQDGYIDISFYGEFGKKAIVKLPEEFDGVVYDYDSEEEFKYNDGAYEFEIYDYDGYINVVIEADEEFTAEIMFEGLGAEEALEGENKATLGSYEQDETYVCKAITKKGTELVSDYVVMQMAIIKQPTAGNPTVKVNFEDQVDAYQWYLYDVKKFEVIDEDLVTDENKDNVIGAEAESGTYEDGAWESSVLYYSATLHDFSIEFEVEEGDLVELVPSTENILMYMAEYEDGSIVELECEDGVYSCTVEKSDEFTVGFLASEEFTAEVTVTRGILGEMVSGQTEETLKNHKAGTFICKVTLENGTVLFLDAVSVAETDIVHSYTNDEDADCNDCGATREITPKPGNGGNNNNNNNDSDNDHQGAVSPDTGNGINMMLVVLLACSFVCAVGILCTSTFNKKKYQ